MSAEAAAESWMEKEASSTPAAASTSSPSGKTIVPGECQRAAAAQEVNGEVTQERRDLHAVASDYAPLAKCLRRLNELRTRDRRKHRRRWVANLIFRLGKVPAGLASSTCRAGAVRFVACSDTHGYHDSVKLPDGEVLLYAGDAVGNYGRSNDLHENFKEFLEWLFKQSQRFSRIFFIAGNHETFLDSKQHGDSTTAEEAKKFLTDFLKRAPNCSYLYNEGASYKGIRLFGSPVTISRLESEGKRYYSRAFERFTKDRSELWSGLPDGLNVLMTHCPPRGRLCSDAVGDPHLAARLEAMAKPPQYHVFGHDHGHLGIERSDKTIFMNVAQDEYLRKDTHGGGCPLVFDVDMPELVE